MTSMKLMYIVAMVLFGTIGMFLRYIGLPSDLVAMCRGFLGSAFIAVLYLAKGKRMDRKSLRENGKYLVLSGVMLGINWIFLFAAYKQTSVAVASLCNYMAPIVIIALAPALYGDNWSVKRVLCVIGAVIGIILVSNVMSAENVNTKGIFLGLGAAAGFVGLVICNRSMKDVPALDRVFVQLLVSALTILPYTIIVNKGAHIEVDALSIGFTIMLGIVHTGFAYCLYLIPMANLPVQSFALLGYIEPVVSVICSAVFLHEPLGIAGVIGAILVIGSAIAGEMTSIKAEESA